MSICSAIRLNILADQALALLTQVPMQTPTQLPTIAATAIVRKACQDIAALRHKLE